VTRARGQVRRSQIITTWGPGSLIDLPRDAGVVAGLEGWGPVAGLDEVDEPRLVGKIRLLTDVGAPRLYAPPVEDTQPGARQQFVDVWRFPLWGVVREKGGEASDRRSRRLVPRKALDEKGRFERLAVVPTRFVRACLHGHVDDLDWHGFVHQKDKSCRRQLWLDEHGTGGELGDLTVRCECGESRPMVDAAEIDQQALGACSGARPWLGGWAGEPCNQPARLLIRTAANAYFPQLLSALSLPKLEDPLELSVAAQWAILQAADDLMKLQAFRAIPDVAKALDGFSDEDVLAAVTARRDGSIEEERPVKEVELDAILAQPEGFDDDIPVDLDFHARRVPDGAWRRSPLSDGIERVVQLHRMREVLALLGFTRFEGLTPDVNGDYDPDDADGGKVRRADLAESPTWFPAVENRGEGVFLALRSDAVADWLTRPATKARIDELDDGHASWAKDRHSKRPFPGGPYILLHTLAHLLMQSLAMRCGYPATSIRERIYADVINQRYGLMLYTASPDAEGTLGGLVQQARAIEDHLAAALRSGSLCSNDPVCAQHSPTSDLERRWLHGAACHGCALVAETSCEMRNDLLDRALVTPTLAVPDAAFFLPER
jgi:hypothetical protein